MKVCSTCRRCFEDDAIRCVDPSHPHPLEELRVPLEIAGRWRIERLVSGTDWSADFMGRHIELGRQVAIRVATGEGTPGPALSRARIAARSIAAIREEHLARVEDFGAVPGSGSYTIVERFGDETLRQAIDRIGPLPLPDAVALARQIAEAVAACAAHGVTPPTSELASDQVRVGRDVFGAPRVAILHFPTEEQTDPSAMVPAIGSLLYEMLIGKTPAATPEPILNLRSNLPEALAWLVDQSVHRSTTIRPRSVAEMARRLRDLERSAGEPAPWPAPPPPPFSGAPDATAPVSLFATTAIPRQVGASPNRIPPSRRPRESAGAAAVRAIPPPPPPVSPAPPPSAAPPPLDSFPIDRRASHLEAPAEEPPRPRRSAAGLLATLLALAIVVGAAAWVIITRMPSRSAAEPPEPAATALPLAEVTVEPASPPTRAPATRAPATAVPTAIPETNAGASSPGPVPASPEAADPELRAALQGWVTSTNARDTNAQLSYYMPRLSTFYLERNVSRDVVRRVKSQLFALGPVDIRVGEPQITITPDGRAATMRFRKDYEVDSQRGPRRGAVLQELGWVRTPEGWKILSERDARVIDR